jgi:PAS domain S-box-containing protein
VPASRGELVSLKTRRTGRLNLGTKFIVLTSCLVLITALVIGLYVIRDEQRDHYELLLNHGRSLVIMIAQNTASAIDREDMDSLSRILDMISNDPSIAYIFMLNADERVLIYKTAEDHPIHIPSMHGSSADPATGILHRSYYNSEDGKHYLNIMAPVSVSADGMPMQVSSGGTGTTVGYIHLGISQEDADRMVRRSLYSVLIFTALIIVLGITITIVITRRIIAPINELNQATREISEGKLDRQINIRTNDEVSDLAIAFNQMLERLQLSHLNIERNTAELNVALDRMRQEIAERERTEAALKESERKYRTIFEESKDVIFISSFHDGKFLDINRAGAELFGYPSAESLKALDPRRDLFNDTEEYTVLSRMLESQGFVKDHEVTMKKSNGELLTVLVTAAIVRDQEGAVFSYRGVFHDVTDKRRLEQQLAQSQKMEAIGQLAGGIAHDFNNILTAIMGYCNLLLMDIPEDSPLKDHADHILSSSERAANLTRSLLSFSRKQVMSPKPINMNEIVITIEKLLRRLIGEDIELRTVLDPGEVMVLADSGQIEQVLINLCTNARDAMPGGGVITLAISTAVVRHQDLPDQTAGRPGAYAVIVVSDTGTGIDARIRDKIFDPFFTTKETGKGTGLGLSIVYGIMKQHNGFITVDSSPGRGSRFKLYLPLIEAPVVASREGSAPRPRGGTETILLAEDDDEVRKLIRLVLSGNGYRVIEAVDGQDALAVLSRQNGAVDLLLLDIIMPRKNGKEVYDTVRSQNPGMKAIFMSGYTADIIDKKGIIAENLNFIPKPIAPLELLALVRSVLDGKSGQS